MLRFLLPVFLLLAAFDSTTNRAFEIDAEHSFLTFEVNRFGMVDVVGSFAQASGSIVLDDQGQPTSTSVVIPTNSLYLGESAGRFQAVAGPAFLNIANYPEITFESTQIDGRVATGDLTILGTTKTISFPFEFSQPFVDPTGLTTIGIHAELTINRQDFGMSFARKMPNGVDFIGNDVAIELNILAVESAP